MKASELRIENLVESTGTNGNPDKWVLIRCNAMHIVTCEMYPQNFRPIPLTEEWLLKFGFKDDEPHFVLPLMKLSASVRLDTYAVEWQLLYDQYSKAFSIFIKGLGHAGIIKLDYVHQLQNLYHSLTGTELTIKE